MQEDKKRLSIVPNAEANSSTFLFEDHDVRVQTDDKGVLWFVAKDVAEALDIAWSGQTLTKISDSWKGMMKFITPGGTQEFQCINETAVYKLAFRSNKPAAERFTDWVAAAVLPSLRRTGSFTVNHPPMINYEQVAAKAICGLQIGKSYKELALTLGCTDSLANAQTAQFLKREVDMDVSNLLVENKADVQDPLVTPTEIGKALDISPRKVNLILSEIGLQCRIERKNGKQKWDLTPIAFNEYAQIFDVGKKHSDGTPVQQIKWYKNRTVEKLREYL